MPLDIRVRKEIGGPSAGVVTLKLTGSLDTATAPELEKQLASVLADSTKDVVFDLAQLKFISSAGLRVFANARKRLKGRGGQASFWSMSSRIGMRRRAGIPSATLTSRSCSPPASTSSPR